MATGPEPKKKPVKGMVGAQRKIDRCLRGIKAQRKNATHQMTNTLTRKFRILVTLDLNMSRMMRGPVAKALAKKAIERGYGAYLVRAYELVEDLRRDLTEHYLDRRLRVYLASKVLVVDEFGIWPSDREAATAFFTLVSARYVRGSIILTYNKGFGECSELLGDTVIASAVLDRLLHHNHVLRIRGDSHRLREKRHAGLFSSHHLLDVGAEDGNENYTD